jgi:decaprenylphospho-beta-D-erythro-pentofuranosid-2-ulose 2-reductase
MKSIVIVGATSAVAQSIARLHAVEHDRIFLIGRNRQRIEQIANDLQVRGAESCEIFTLNLVDTQQHSLMWDYVYEKFPKPDIVYFAHGTLPNQIACQASYKESLKALDVNALSTISLLTDLSNRMEIDRQGHIVVISSVAGDRGRQSNYVYGTAKSMLSIFTQGLRNRLCDKQVRVTTVKPGFIDTPMTAEFDKGALWASPDKVAQDIFKGVKKGRNIIYTPLIWFFIMSIIKHIPELIFKKLSL